MVTSPNAPLTMTRRVLIGAALFAGVATSALAQGVAPDARWQGWLGCWQPVTPASADSYADWMATRARDAGLPVLCIVPSTTATSVEFVTVAAGKVTARETIDAADSRVARKRDSCDGSEGASWSDNGRRIYLRSRYLCSGNVSRTSSGMLTMTPDGQLLDIEEIASGGAKSVRVSRYRSVAAPAGFAIDSATVLSSDAVPVSAARTSIAAALTGADIVDAMQNADTLVVEAWLVERNERFNLDAKHLLALADAGVPGRITDLMVALAYPNVFAFDRTSRLAAMRAAPSRVYANAPNVDPFGYRYDPYGYGSLGYGYPYSRYNGYNGYGYNGYGYGGYGYGYGGYVYQPPIVIVRGGGAGQPHGRVVNGQGYTRNQSPTSDPTPATRTPSSSSGTGASSSSGSSSGATASPAPASGETRQAKPRP